MKRILLHSRNLLLSSLLFFGITFSAIAEDNPLLIGYPPEKIMGFRGLDTQTPDPNIEDGRATDLLNVKLSTSLDLRRRYGMSVINSATLDDLDLDSPAITGIFDSEYSTGISRTYAFVGNKLKYDNSGTWTTVSGTATMTAGQNNQFICVMALDNAICTNDTDVPLQINSTPTHSPVTFTGLSDTVTRARAVIWYRNYLILGNTTEASTARPTRFRWSNVGTINTWSNNDFVDISSLGGDEIVGFQELYGDLYIFLRRSIWKASLVGGNDIFVFTKVVDGIGAISKGSIQLIDLPQNRFGVIFLEENRRVLIFNGVIIEDIGYIIQPTLDDLNAARLQYAVGVYDGANYFLSASDGGSTTNDVMFDLQLDIFEWSKHSQLDANALARVKESTSLIKTYLGNYSAFVYWMDNPDNINDVDGATGVVDSVETDSVNGLATGVQVIVDTGITSGIYTGAIIRITSGTGAGQERVILTGINTGVIITSAFSTTPDSTSNYSIGDINAFYQTKWYDFGDAPRYKAFRGMFFWGKEETNNEVTVSYTEDYGAELGTVTKSLSPSGSSLWDVALWDVGVWGTTGDKLYTVQQTGQGRVIQMKFSQPNVDKTFHIYGFHLLADRLDRE